MRVVPLVISVTAAAVCVAPPAAAQMAPLSSASGTGSGMSLQEPSSLQPFLGGVPGKERGEGDLSGD